ncbi:MAG TPA: phage tail assembly protein [Armatimonadota bacterium]|jgi:hypothetical protein
MPDEQQPIEGQGTDQPAKIEVALPFLLKRELTFEGKKYTSLTLEFNDLTGNDILDAERAYVLQGGTPGVAELQKGYLVQIVARAAGVPVELLHALSASDVSKLTLQAQNFLLG